MGQRENESEASPIPHPCNACSWSWHCRALGCSSGQSWTEPEASKEEGPSKHTVVVSAVRGKAHPRRYLRHTASWAWHSLFLPYSGSYHWASQLQLRKLLLGVRYKEMQMCLGSFHKVSEQSSSSIQPSVSTVRLSLAFQLSHRQTQLRCQHLWSSPSCCIRSQRQNSGQRPPDKANKLVVHAGEVGGSKKKEQKWTWKQHYYKSLVFCPCGMKPLFSY